MVDLLLVLSGCFAMGVFMLLLLDPSHESCKPQCAELCRRVALCGDVFGCVEHTPEHAGTQQSKTEQAGASGSKQ
jgi:hypothetical protein